MESSTTAAGGGPIEATPGSSEPLGCIYLITCLETNGLYVGQTIHPCIEDRFDEHLYAALVRKTRTYLYNAMRKYGPDMFSIELLCAVPYDSLNRMEEYWAEQLNTYVWDCDRNFNMVWCGQEKRRGIKHTKEAIEKMKKNWEENREKYLEQMRSPERRFLSGSVNRGKNYSPEERKKLSDACKAWWTPERRKKWGERVKSFMTEEQRAKISESCATWWTEEKRKTKSEAMKSCVTQSDRMRSSQASLSFWNDPNNRTRMSEMKKGKTRAPYSESARANMSIAAKGIAKSQLLKDSLRKTAARKFAELFQLRLKEWIADPESSKQWRYDMTRKKRDGRLLDEYIAILDNTPGWTWSSRS